MKQLLVALVAGAACAPQPPPASGSLTISVEQQSSWVRNFNPMAPAGSARWPSSAGVYEPLLVFDSVTNAFVPWLATGWEWRDDNLTLRFALRDGVQWSDGEPFTANDVAYTFAMIKKTPALDRSGVWRFLSGVKAIDAHTVDFGFSRVFLPGLDDVSAQPIVAEHVWKEVKDPLTFSNPTPVGTGPFTEITRFENQVFELGRNPHYWQAGKPKVERLRFPAYPSNERANLALAFGEVDWAANFVPAIDRVFVARDPEHHRYWFPLTGSTIFLYPNTRRAPFDRGEVRKAISLAIDRALLVNVALYGYSRPADITGLSDAYASWRSEAVAQADDWLRFDATAAGAMLDAAGLQRDAKGVRHLADGSVWELEVLTVAGWSDWVRAAQVIARNLRALGIEAKVRAYDFGAWFERLQKGDFALSLGWSAEGPTPYTFYRSLMSAGTLRPIGESSNENWGRFESKTADGLLAKFEREPDVAGQHALVKEIETVFAAEAPSLPLYPNPSWAAYNTTRFTGFPSAENPYADPSPNKSGRGECLLVLTALEPR